LYVEERFDVPLARSNAAAAKHQTMQLNMYSAFLLQDSPIVAPRQLALSSHHEICRAVLELAKKNGRMSEYVSAANLHEYIQCNAST